MDSMEEKRSSERHPHNASLVFSVFNHRNCVDARSIDYCADGLKFKSSCALHPGTTICIRIKRGYRDFHPGSFLESVGSVSLAEVKWCRELDDADALHYEVGVRYYPPYY
jgi:hypothetical protein